MSELEEHYEDRISHLRSGLKMAEDDINLYKKMLGLQPNTWIQPLLDEDIKRGLKKPQTYVIN